MIYLQAALAVVLLVIYLQTALVAALLVIYLQVALVAVLLVIYLQAAVDVSWVAAVVVLAKVDKKEQVAYEVAMVVPAN